MSIRHSDGHVILAVNNAADASTADLKVWDITDAGTITALTDVITNADNRQLAQLYINQGTNDLYVLYGGKAAGSDAWTGSTAVTVNICYKKSTDGGTSWGSETCVNTNAASVLRSIETDIGGTCSLFLPVWVNAPDNDLLTNPAAGIPIYDGSCATPTPVPTATPSGLPDGGPAFVSNTVNLNTGVAMYFGGGTPSVTQGDPSNFWSMSQALANFTVAMS